jgi:hypothetical protein
MGANTVVGGGEVPSAPRGIEGLLDRVKLRRQLAVIVGAGWVPLVALALIAKARGQAEPLLRDPAVHVRILIAVPLILLAAKVLDGLSDRVVVRLVRDGFIAPVEQVRFSGIRRRQLALRDASLADAVIIAIALAVGIASLRGGVAPSGYLHGSSVPIDLTPARVWYSIVTLPLFRFVMGRALWRLVVWAYFLGAVSRLHLQVVPAHPDQRTGLAFLKRPSLMYVAIVVFAISCVAAAAWAPRLFAHELRLRSLRGFVVTHFSVGVLLAFAPLLCFLPRLVLERLRARNQYGSLASDYARSFHAGWITSRSRGEMLGNQDFQSMNDLSQTFRRDVLPIRPLLFGVRDLVQLAVAALLPLAPLLLAEVPAQQLFTTFARVALGVK